MGKLTYIGFFQYGSKNSTEYWNFYPVFHEWTEGQFVQQFPDTSVQYGRLRLRQKWIDSNNTEGERNIHLDDIDKRLNENQLVKVSFDSNYLEYYPDTSRYDGLIVPKGVNIEDTIEVSNFTMREIVGTDDTDWAQRVDVCELAMPVIRVAKESCAIENFNWSPWLNLPITICDKQEGDFLYSNRIKPKMMTYSEEDRPLVQLSEIVNCTPKRDLLNSVELPIAAGDWDSEEYSLPATETIELVRIYEEAPYKANLSRKLGQYKLIRTETKGHEPSSKSKQEVPVTEKDQPATGGVDTVSTIMEFLKKSGRVVSMADVINYCTCITQSFITTFAGAPGTGKTTLCRLLAKAMGLEEEGDGNSDARYAEISVERGWSSLKDFVGYPNPFPNEKELVSTSKKNAAGKKKASEEDTFGGIIPSNIDACAAFYRMHKNFGQENEEKAPYLMLLDEANLSPIEYYWAQFLRNCQLDDEDELKKRKIHVSQTEAWKISPNLRFLATVNFDHTTEELSPRFLDRSWVITLEAPDGPLSRVSQKPDKPEQPIAMKELQTAFGIPMDTEQLPEGIQGLWEKIQGVFAQEGVRLPLSPRNIQAVENYCIAACRWCDRGYITQEEALDFAVLQKILPTISGYGNRYKKLMDDLLNSEDMKRLPRTLRKLQDMDQAAADNSGFYQFFVR